ncbi:MAG TPA: hypothetical protein PKG71_04665 [Candidatus Woesebacteria bacterium]|nr:hypothetical protein [Candidatus Woesebacteria bacterium]
MKYAKYLRSPLFLAGCMSIALTLLIYAPFALRASSFWGIPLKDSGMQQIYSNWDGPNYVLNAITNYEPAEIGIRAFLTRPNEYYAAHFPLYSWLIRAGAPVFGYWWSALALQIVSGVILNLIFYSFIRTRSKHALWLTFAFTIFPPRLMVLRAVIAPELLLTASMLAALLLWQNNKPLFAGVMGIVAVLLKFQAIILVPVFAITIFEHSLRERKIHIPEIIGAGLPLLGYGVVALFYFFQFGDWHAYFVAQNMVGMGMDVPFSMFNYAKKWVGTNVMETAALYFIGMIMLITKLAKGFPRVYFWFALGYTAMLSLIPQVDIMRLAAPIAPIFFLGFHSFFESKLMRITLILALPMLYLYTINFIMTNQAPIADWSLFQ